MLEQLKEKLSEEVSTLIHELNVVLPGQIETAVAHGDLKENSEYHAALERQGFVRARIDYLGRRMSQLNDIDVEHVSTDRVGFGSEVKVRDLVDDEVEVFKVTLGENLDFDKNEISMDSPLGQALLGKKTGDRANAALPNGEREFEVLELTTIHDLPEV